MVKKIIKKIFPKSIINLGVEVVTFLKVKYYSLIFKSLIIRKNTTDINVFKSIFVFNELELPININPKLIIDAGAYTGLSSLYYSLKYPNAKILAIEPEDSNFKILERHTKNNPNIFRVNAGLWYRDAFLKITDRNTGKWGFVTEETSESNYDIKAVTIDTLLKQSGFDKIDILKLDIEGSERDLFSNDCSSWIDKVNVIAIELHDRIKDGCTKTLYSIINKNDWKEYKKGEKVILVNKKIC